MAISLNPNTFQEGGSLLDDVDVKVTAAKFVHFDYNGTVSPAVPALGLSLQVIGGDGKDNDEYLSCGKPEYFSPSADDKTPSDEGNFLIPVGDKKALNNNTQASKFIESLINAGFPADKMESGDISVLVGMEFHLRREVVKRNNLIRTGKNANREQTVMTVAKINKLPWETAKGVRPNGSASASATSTRTATGVATSASPSNGVGAATAEAIVGLLLEHGQIPKSKLANLVFQIFKGKPEAAAAGKMALDDNFLRGIEGATLTNGILSLAA